MPLPLAVAGLALSAAKKLKMPKIGRKAAPRRRRRRARLTQRELFELTTIKSILGKTAAANALPYYLGRGG